MKFDPDPIFKSIKRNKSFIDFFIFRLMNIFKYSSKIRKRIYYNGSAKT